MATAGKLIRNTSETKVSFSLLARGDTTGLVLDGAADMEAAAPESILKTCTKCGHAYPLEHFYKQKRGKYGRRSQCRLCMLAYGRKFIKEHPECAANWRKRNPDWLRNWLKDHPGYLRKYRASMTVAQKQKRKATDRRWHLDHPDAVRAHSAVHYAIKTGRLICLACESCGNPNAIAHHDDYQRPLDVRWLCESCHRFYHMKQSSRGFTSAGRLTLKETRDGT